MFDWLRGFWRRGSVSNAATVPGWPLSDDTLAAVLGSRASSAGVDVGPNEALSLSAVFAAVWLLARVQGTLPLGVYRRRTDRGRDLLIGHRAYKLLHSRPNPMMTAASFRSTLEFHRRLWGNCYAEIQWDGGGNPMFLWPVVPWRVRPRLNDARQLVYEIDGRRTVAAPDMIHVPLTSHDGVVGKSFVEYAITSLGLSISAQEFAARFFGNGARPGGLLKHPGNPPEPLREQVKKEWKRSHQGPANAHQVAALWGGWEFDEKAGSISPQDSQLVETRKFTTEEVSRWTGVQLSFLAELTTAIKSNIEEQGINFVVYCVGPSLVDYEQEYDVKLLNPPQIFSKHNVGGLLRGNMQARASFYKELFGMAVVSPNDIAELEDRNPIGPEGDKYFVAANNFQPIERVIAGQPAAAAASSAQANSMRNVAESHVALIAHELDRLLNKEINAARRASKTAGTLVAWAESFYAEHRKLLTTALQPAVAAINSVTGQAVGTLDAAAIAAAWCDRSIAEIYAFAEHGTDAEQLFAAWRTRAAETAETTLKPFFDCEDKPCELNSAA